MPSSRRRLSAPLTTIVVLAGVGGLCWWGAQEASAWIEQRSREDVTLALSTAGQDWVTVTTDGLQVRLQGTAPNEVERFRAMTQASSAVDASRIIDEMTVAATEALTPPEFKIELLRDDDGISLIGLVPASTDRADMVRILRNETAAPKITDLLESADYPLPDGWEAATEFGIRAAQMATRAKISVGPGWVKVSAITDSRAEKGRLETGLKQAKPDSVELETDISAPRPVIAPFTMRFTIDADGAHLDACAADNADGQARIVDAATKAGIEGKLGCTLGLGSPSPNWAEAVVQSIGAVADLGLGTVTLSDADIALTVPAEIPEDRFTEVTGRLEQRLPPVFSLHANRERPDDAPQGPAAFIASVSEDDVLSMQGRIADARMGEAVDSFSRSRFTAVNSTLSSQGDVPEGWTLRVIAGLEALDALNSGTVEVTPDLVTLTGTSGDPHAPEQTAARLGARLGAGARYDLSIRYDRRLDLALDLPDGEECVQRLNIIMSESEIGFEPSKSTIAGDPEATLARMSDAMVDCNEFQIEAGGHTDSQGSQGFNADLSRARAQTLVAAMQDAGIDTSNMTARGYGESQPIASNDSEEGREENRRIEFRLMSPYPVRNEPLAAPTALSGVTTDKPARDSGNSKLAPDTGDTGDSVEFEGPQLPTITTTSAASGMVPATVGVSEEFQTMDEREENTRLPVQTPDATTPRPSPRPEDELQAEEEDQNGTE
ncbi:OmpA family protein [Paracoccus sp. Z330]|uniref:OmpA family protein n=1 Tax=Paracoccus onchidii TaxID=3017813 RepID=A0ABT4ZDG2_9RHOB|nr:OmpA family protein [Paracoccus onchidii]MDB6176700.1 OmpA family protein [Paracoccus onchidii]